MTKSLENSKSGIPGVGIFDLKSSKGFRVPMPPPPPQLGDRTSLKVKYPPITFLFLLTERKYVLSSPQYGGAHDRVSSPPSN